MAKKQKKRKYKRTRKFNGKEYHLAERLPKNKREVIQGKTRKDRKVVYSVTSGDREKAKKFHKKRGYNVRVIGDRLYTRKKEK